MLLRAFRRDYDVNGPSIVRMLGTVLKGYLRHRDNPDPRVRERFRWETRDLRTTYAGIFWAAERWFRSNPAVRAKIRAVRDDLRAAFGWRSVVWGAARRSGPPDDPLARAAAPAPRVDVRAPDLLRDQQARGRRRSEAGARCRRGRTGWSRPSRRTRPAPPRDRTPAQAS